MKLVVISRQLEIVDRIFVEMHSAQFVMTNGVLSSNYTILVNRDAYSNKNIGHKRLESINLCKYRRTRCYYGCISSNL